MSKKHFDDFNDPRFSVILEELTGNDSGVVASAYSFLFKLDEIFSFYKMLPVISLHFRVNICLIENPEDTADF